MPFNNFENRHFTPAEVTAVNDALSALESALGSKLANLSAEERKQYGSINEQNKLIVNKVKDYHDTQAGLSAPDVDWDEFNSDYESRTLLQSVLHRIEALQTGINNAKILHDWDNYQAALTDYDYAKYKNSTSATGYETKVKELSQFFTGGGSSKAGTGAEEKEPG